MSFFQIGTFRAAWLNIRNQCKKGVANSVFQALDAGGPSNYNNLGSQQYPMARRSSFCKAFLAPYLLLPSPSPQCALCSSLRIFCCEVGNFTLRYFQYLSINNNMYPPQLPHLPNFQTDPNRKEVENFTSLRTPSPHRVIPVDW